jgi:hypothetical protein
VALASTSSSPTAQAGRTLLVVPPEATSQAAQHVLDTAGGPDNADSVASLLGPVSTRDTADLGRAERGVAG